MNIKISALSTIIITFVTSVAFGQEKLLTMEDAFQNVRTSLAPATLKQIKWIKNSDNLSFVARRGGDEYLMRKDPLSGKETELVGLNALNAAARKLDAAIGLPVFPTVDWLSDAQFKFTINQRELVYDLKKRKVTLFAERFRPAEAENEDIEPLKNHIAYTLKNNLFISDGRQQKQVTNDTNEHIVNGQAVHRNEFGITKGTFWSPKGNYLAFYRMDETMVADYPVIDWTVKPAKNKNIKYPMAGDKSHEVTVGVYSLSSGKTVFLRTGEPKDQYLTNVAWSPDELHIYIAVLNRDQNHMKLNCYNAQSGEFEKTLFEEKDEKYTEPLNPVVFLKNDPHRFIWQSQRDGFNHLYLYDTDGKLIRQLTKGKWVVTDFKGFDKEGKKVFFSSTINSPVTRDLCSVDLQSGKTTRLTQGEGTHKPELNDRGSLILDEFSNLTTPRQLVVYTSAGKKVRTLLNAPNPLKDYSLGQLSIFRIQGEAGDSLYCRMYKPVGFDPAKRYPVVVYQYGGPHVQLVNNTWNAGSSDLWFQYMAERGFLVFTLDPHGSYNRGKAFEQATFRKLGDVEMKDQLRGVQYLKNLPFVDQARMGLFGWSFGGFMTASIMTRNPGIFRAAVAGGPVVDWSYYEVMYTERYMDTPQQNPEGYRNSSILNHIDGLDGKLLVIHGTQDATVVWQQSIMLLKSAIDKGKQLDYMIYPGHEHNVRGKDRVHLFNKITGYFEENLASSGEKSLSNTGATVPTK